MENITLNSALLNPVFGKVSYKPMGAENEVMFTIMMTSVGEQWNTGVAIDCSSSMRTAFGRNLIGTIPPDVVKKYKKKGWTKKVKKDGHHLMLFEKEAYDDAVSQGYLERTENIVQTEGRIFIAYLANALDVDGNTTVIYWACGKGDEVEVLGKIEADKCETIEIIGPTSSSFGNETHLLPAIKYFEENNRDKEKGMYIFITDGRIDDLEDVKPYCIDLAKKIEREERAFFKCVLIGVGDEINEDQMIELDDLETGTEIDIWDHKIAKDMRMIEEIFVELVDETIVVATPCKIYDDSNNVIINYSDGLPGRVIFRMPSTSKYFELEVGNQERIRQQILE